MLFPHKKVIRLQIESRHIFDGMASACVPWTFHKMAAFPSGVEMMVGTNRHYTHEAGQHGASRKELQLI
jgi:hypothetical protein